MTRAATLSADQRAVVAQEVEAMLRRNPAYRAMSPSERRAVAGNTAAIVETLAEQRGSGGADPYAVGLADPPLPFAPPSPVPTPTAAPTPDRWRADERFRAEGVAAGVTQLGRMVNEVNFPGFVASLVKGTFQAVVDASIQQMKAYGELVQSVALSLGEFRDQNVSEGQGHQQLVERYPRVFTAKPGPDGTNRASLVDGFDSDMLPDFMKDLGLAEPVEDLEEEGAIDRLVQASRDDIARNRQQLLATTLMMGINRIIVTDGRINAKIVFDFSAQDNLARTGTFEDYETHKKILSGEISTGSRLVRGYMEQPVPLKVSSTTGTSQTDIVAKAKLTGEVSLRFRSETFPLQEMVNTDQMMRISAARSGAQSPAAAPAPETAQKPA